MKNHITKWGVITSLAIVATIGIAICAGALDFQTAFAGVLTAEAVSAVELKKLEEAFHAAIGKLNENAAKAQDALTKALDESKRLGGVIEAKTNDTLKAVDENRVKVQDEFKEIRDQLLEVHQKMATKPHGGGEEMKSLYDVITESEEWKAASSRPGAKSMDAVNVGSFHKYWNTQITNAPGQNQPLVPAQRVDGLVNPPEQRLYVRDLLPQGTTDSNAIEYAEETAFTNNAGAQGDTSPVGTGEGELKRESALTFVLRNEPVRVIAHWIPASRQILADAKMLQGYISARLIYGLKLKEETDLLFGDGGAGTVSGLMIKAIDFQGGVTNQTILDTLLKAMLQATLSNYEASGVVMHPVDWTNAVLLKDTTGRYIFSNPQEMTSPRIWSKPVVPTQSMNIGRFLVGAFNLGAQIWDREDANVRISENVNDHFIRNMVAILAEERLALTVYRPSAFVKGNVSNAG